MQADIDEVIYVKLVGELANLLVKVDPTYQQFITYEGKRKVVYKELDKALYGTIQAAQNMYRFNTNGTISNAIRISR